MNLRIVFADGEFLTCKDCYEWAVAAIRWNGGTGNVRAQAAEMCEDGRAHCATHVVSSGIWED